MRTLLRPFVFIALLTVFTSNAQAQQGGSGGGNPPPPAGNTITFVPGSPSATVGGVDVSIAINAAAGFTCTSVTISCVDHNNKTLATVTINNPGATASQSFMGLGSGVAVTIQVNSVFQSGNQFDYPYLEDTVTTN
jgi:hypothetical protein